MISSGSLASLKISSKHLLMSVFKRGFSRLVLGIKCPISVGSSAVIQIRGGKARIFHP